jgi:hypothetical protein
VVCSEAPLSDLDTLGETIVMAALERIAAERALVVSFPASPTDGVAKALVERADYRIEISRGRVVGTAAT